jgi:toxin secretion/phage lysis holin
MVKGFSAVLQWLALAAAVMSGIWARLDIIYQVLLVFIAADVISGAIRAVIQKTLSSRTAYEGILRKTGELMLVAVSAYAQRLIPGGSGLHLPEALAGFYVYVESISTLENLAIVGVPIPPFLRDALLKLAPPEKMVVLPQAEQVIAIVDKAQG